MSHIGDYRKLDTTIHIVNTTNIEYNLGQQQYIKTNQTLN